MPSGGSVAVPLLQPPSDYGTDMDAINTETDTDLLSGERIHRSASSPSASPHFSSHSSPSAALSPFSLNKQSLSGRGPAGVVAVAGCTVFALLSIAAVALFGLLSLRCMLDVSCSPALLAPLSSLAPYVSPASSSSASSPSTAASAASSRSGWLSTFSIGAPSFPQLSQWSPWSRASFPSPQDGADSVWAAEPMNSPLTPDSVLASDGLTYALTDYADGYLVPHKTPHNVANETEWSWYSDIAELQPLPSLRPYPPRATPPKPRVDFILRTFAGYSPLTTYMLQSIDMFVPWRAMGEVIVVLDDSPTDRAYASSLPDWVRVHHETPPAFFEQWGGDSGAKNLGAQRAKNGYQLGLYSNWVSDRYSEADYICVLDPDMMFHTRGSLPLLFDWDEAQQLYKPIWICTDYFHPLFPSSHDMFDWSREPREVGCMNQLPVCLHRDTLRKVRSALVQQSYEATPEAYQAMGLNTTFDRDSDYAAYLNHSASKALAAGDSAMHSELTSGTVVPLAAFDLTYLYLVNRRSDIPLCQFCVWGAYIWLHEEENRRYSIKRQGVKEGSDCSQLRGGTHVGYLTDRDKPKLSSQYFSIGDRLLQEGVCRASPSDGCNKHYCEIQGFHHDFLQYSLPSQPSDNRFFPALVDAPLPTSPADRSRHTDNNSSLVSSTAAEVPHLPPVDILMRQQMLLAFEWQPQWASDQQKQRCLATAMLQTQQLYEWIQLYDTAPQKQLDRQCLKVNDALSGRKYAAHSAAAAAADEQPQRIKPRASKTT